MAAVEGGFGHCRGNAETVRRQEYRTLVGSCFAIAVALAIAIAIAIANIIAISIAPAFALSLVVETGFVYCHARTAKAR
jgi:hypothetical protein